MLSLRETQIAFCAAIRADGGAAPDGLIVDDGIAPERRVQIYRNNHRLGALAAMQANYPVVERLGGAEWFAQSVMRYQASHPSRSGDLQNLGAQYPQFLSAELADGEYSYFADVARLESAYQVAMTAQEHGTVDIAVLQSFAAEDYENLRFIPRPAMQLVESTYPIFAIWQANQPSAQTAAPIRLDAGDSRVLLIRRSDHVELREMAAGSFELLRQFALGASLGAAAEAAAAVASAAAAESASFDLSMSLRELLGLEVIAEITVAIVPNIQ